MRVRLVRATVAANAVHDVGAVLDLPDEEARALVALKKAVPEPIAAPEPQPDPQSDPVATVVQHQAPPRRRTR